MNWGALKTAVTGYSARSAASLSGMWSTWLALAEQRIYQGDPRTDVDQLRVAQMLTTVSPFTTATVPSDSVQLDRLTLIRSGRRRQLELRPLGEITTLQTDAGDPKFYGIQGTSIVYGPALSSTDVVELLYWAKFAAPSADTDENWLMANAPAVYLHAILAEVWDYLMNADKREQSLMKWAAAQKALLEQDDQDVHSGSHLRVVNSGMTRW